MSRRSTFRPRLAQGKRYVRAPVRILAFLAAFLLTFGFSATAQDDVPVELGWRKAFSGTVTALGDGRLELELADAQRIVFDIVAGTEAVPSEMAVKVGSKVDIVATQRRLIRVQVVPFAEWLKRQPVPEPAPRI